MSGIIAPRTYRPGDLIYEERVFAHACSTSEACETCCKSSSDLKLCTECREVKYCSKACQKSEWNDHKLECEYLKNLTKGLHRSFVRLVGKVILKVKDKDWKSIQQQVLNTNVTFDDIDSYGTDRGGDVKITLFHKEIKELTRKYIGKQNMPTDEDFYKIVGKVLSCNVVGRSFSEETGFFFLGISKFAEECIPTTNVVIDKNILKIWACKRIKKGSGKISVKTSDHLPDPLFKHIDTMNDKCKCTDCTLPYGESVLSKIVDENKAFSVICETENFLNKATCLLGQTFEPSAKQVDELLKKHDEVLGDTNYLHLKLLELVCAVTVHPHRLKEFLKKYEACARKVYGDYSMELVPAYKKYITLCFRLRDAAEAALYIEKLKKVQMDM